MSAAHTPAFPAGRRFEGAEGWQTEEGMTLRDYFAAKAMQGILSNPAFFSELQNQADQLDLHGHPTSAFKLVSELCNDMACAMMEARK